jgi:site-specific recombinase XerD
VSDLDRITLITEPSAEWLNDRQEVDYRTHRERCLSWLIAVGKTPKRGEGYAVGTVKPRSQRMDRFYRWVWEHEGGYTLALTQDHADDWLQHLARTDTSVAHKANCQKALQMLYKWREHEQGADAWEPSIRFSSTQSATQPREYVSDQERRALREAALEYGAIPSYSDLDPDARDRWRRHLAQRFGKPIDEVEPEDWERANGWKIPSLVWTSLDAGLRPVEVARAVVGWVDLANDVLRIPKERSAKSSEPWVVSLQDRTARMLERWLEEREVYDRYADSDHLWLTSHGNPYRSQALKYVLERLCTIAGIDHETRDLSWYAIRHSVGTYMTREEDLAAAQTQLRHTSEQTTMKYDQTPVEDRRQALDRMG